MNSIISTETKELENTLVAGNTLKVVSACAAVLKKENINGKLFFSYKKGIDWPSESSISLEFINKIGKKFGRIGKIFGYVNSDDEKASGLFKEYYQNNDFESFVKNTLENLCSAVNDLSFNNFKDGYFVFSHFKNKKGEDYILIVFLGKTEGFDIENNEQMIPKDITSLNIQDFRFAASLNLSEFIKSYPDNSGESYFYFIKGNSKSETLVKALGCSDSVSAAICMSNLTSAINDYIATEKNLKIKNKAKIVESVQDYLKSKSGEKVNLTEIFKIVEKEIPVDANIKSSFEDFVSENSEKYKISTEFQPSYQSINKLSYIQISSLYGGFDGKFKLNSLGDESSNAEVIYSEDYSYIKIRLSRDASEQIKKLTEQINEG